jgi:hypothetical protein
MADLSYELNSRWRATLTLQGEIAQGDAKRFEELAQKVSQKHLDRECTAITAALDSPGGDYMEGLILGKLFWQRGYQTWVKANAECYSAAAFAFLGGTLFHTVGGWSPDRHVEVGASIGFHGFYSNSTRRVALSEGIERGKFLTMVVADYANTLRVNPKLIVESIKKKEDELLHLITIEDFRDLGIALHGTTPLLQLNEQGAVNAANYATGWKRPVALRPKAGETQAIISSLSAADYRRRILRHVAARRNPVGPIASLVRQAAASGAAGEVEAVYRDAEQLSIVPNVGLRDTDRVQHIRGFDYGGGFYTTDCYVKPFNEGLPNFGVHVVRVAFKSHFELIPYTPRGDILYELHSPKTVLWSAETDSPEGTGP